MIFIRNKISARRYSTEGGSTLYFLKRCLRYSVTSGVIDRTMITRVMSLNFFVKRKAA